MKLPIEPGVTNLGMKSLVIETATQSSNYNQTIYPACEQNKTKNLSRQQSNRVSINTPDISHNNSLIQLCDSILNSKIEHYCKQFCYNNRSQYQCTLDKNWGAKNIDSSLCEWGNATYTWVLGELVDDEQLSRLSRQDNYAVPRYFDKIINSVSFWERYKDWRFQRKTRTPEYIRILDQDAKKIFCWLCDNDSAANIAQRLNRNEEEISKLISNIYTEMFRRKKGHLLKSVEFISLTNQNMPDENNDGFELTGKNLTFEEIQNRENINIAYKKLSWQEQFILDVMIIDGLSAKSTLKTLVNQNISLDKKTSANDLTAQHIYYFLRKTISKLKKLMESE